MTINRKDDISKYLADIPFGQISTFNYNPLSLPNSMSNKYTLFEHHSKGIIERYTLFEGIYITCFTFYGTGIRFIHKNLPKYNFTYITQGNSYWEQDCLTSSFMQRSQMALTPQKDNFNFTFRFPESYFQGCILNINPGIFLDNMPSWLTEMNFSLDSITKFFDCTNPYAITPPKEISDCFESVFRVPQEYRFPYLRLKVQELLWELSRLDINIPRTPFKPIDKFDLIHKIEKYLTDHVSTYVSVNKLSQIFPLDKTTIQTTFKDVYGKPIATYMKDYRLNLAKAMLLGGTESVTAIAQQCGFSPSGFAATFKKDTGLTPSEFRAQNKQDN